MTALETATPDLADHVAAAAEAAAAHLPATAGWQAEFAPAGEPVPLPDPDARAVGTTLAGGTRLILVAHPTLARQVQVGPPPAEDLLDGTARALGAAAAALEPATGTTDAGPVAELPTAELASLGATAAVRLLDGEDHVATLVVVAPAPEAPDDDPPPATSAPTFEPLGNGAPNLDGSGLELLHDVEMGLTVELGRARMLVRDVLGLAPGSVVELDRAAGSPVDILVNGTLIGRGEVVVIDEEFGVRITEVVGHRAETGPAHG